MTLLTKRTHALDSKAAHGAEEHRGRRAIRWSRRQAVNASLAQRGFVGLALLLVALSVAVSLSNALAADDAWVIETNGRLRAVMQTLSPGLVILAGLVASLRMPLVGGMVALAGAAVFATMMWWTVLIPMLALLLAWSTLAGPM